MAITPFDELAYRWAEWRLGLPPGSVIGFENEFSSGRQWSDITFEEGYYFLDAITESGHTDKWGNPEKKVLHELGFIQFPQILKEMWELQQKEEGERSGKEEK